MQRRRHRAGQHRRSRRRQPRRRRPRGRRLRRRRRRGPRAIEGARGGGVGRRRRRGEPRSPCCRCRRRPSCARSADEWATTAARGVDPRRPLDQQPRRWCASSARGSRPPGTTSSRRRSPVARSAPRTACCRSWSAATTTPSPACSRCSNRSGARSCHLGAARARQHDEARQQPHRVHHDVGEPRGAVARRPSRASRCSGPSRCCAPTASPTSTSTAWSRASTTRNRPTQFALELAAKDAGLIVETGRALGVPTPRAPAVLQVLVGAIAAGLGDHDWSDLVAAAERQGDVELQWNTDSPSTNLRQQTAYNARQLTQVRCWG